MISVFHSSSIAAWLQLLSNLIFPNHNGEISLFMVSKYNDANTLNQDSGGMCSYMHCQTLKPIKNTTIIIIIN